MLNLTVRDIQDPATPRPSSFFSTRVEAQSNTRLGPIDTWLASVWFGMAAGLLETAIGLWSRNWLNRVTLVSLRMNRHSLWMIPITDLLIFAIIGIPFALLAWQRSRAANGIAFAGLGFLAGLVPLLAFRRLHPIACAVLAAGFSLRLTSTIVSRPEGFAKLVRRTLWILALATATWSGFQYVAVAGAERRALAALPPAAPGAPNVLLIVLDTVRADRLGFQGYGRDTTPRLDQFASHAVRFEQARATAPWTLPSHVSMFTGRLHHEMDISAYRTIDKSYPMLAELLRDHGYATAGFVANTFNCNAAYGLDRGFARYEDFRQNQVISMLEALNSTELGRNVFHYAGVAYNLGLDPDFGRKDAATINRDALSWLSGQGERPFFVFLNYFDAHDPYVLPEGTKAKFGPASPTREQDSFLRLWSWVNRRTLTPSDITLLRDAYDDGIAYLDDQLGRLFDELGRRKLLENTLVIVTSDHGEHLGEHRLYGHAKSLYRQETHVPLLMFGLPRIPEGRTVSQPVSLRDLPATIFDLLGILDHSPFPGQSLARFWAGKEGEAPATDPVLSETILRTTVSRNPNRAPALRGPMQAIADGQFDYIVNSDGVEELYNFVTDPEELSDLARNDQARPALERVRALLKQVLGSGRRGGGEEGPGLMSGDTGLDEK